MKKLTNWPQGQHQFGRQLHLAGLINWVKGCFRRLFNTAAPVYVKLTVVYNNHVFYSSVNTVKGVHYQEVNNEAEKAQTNDCE